MGIKLTNNAFATLAASINSSATSITLTTGQGARFPTLGAGDYFYATLIDTSNNLEIVKCTARSTDVLTVVRAQESTTARAYNTGDRIEIRLTAATFTDAVNEIGPTQVSDEANTSTGYMMMPVGTTAQRPGVPASGMFRMNSTTNNPEWYNPTTSSWIAFSDQAQYAVEYLVIAGGGGGGSRYGGGGGAGGYRCSVVGESSGGGASAESPLVVNVGTAYTVTIGAGGAEGNPGTSGSNSVFGSITSSGGGRSGGEGASGISGGSGGGASYGASSAGGAGTTGQGYRGGNVLLADTAGNGNAGSGGGGAGAAGQDRPNNGYDNGTNGGTGVTSSITGSAVTRAGGGGGGGGGYTSSSIGGSGGSGGGGAGGGGTGGGGSNATVNTGSGGGGGDAGANLGGNGGSGIVIVRYLGPQRATGGTITSANGYTIHTFTSSGTFTA